MEKQVVLAGGRVVDPSEGVDEIRDIGICNGQIVPPETIPNAKRENMAGKVIAPGFIDVHVHLRELCNCKLSSKYTKKSVKKSCLQANGGFSH